VTQGLHIGLWYDQTKATPKDGPCTPSAGIARSLTVPGLVNMVRFNVNQTTTGLVSSGAGRVLINLGEVYVRHFLQAL